MLKRFRNDVQLHEDAIRHAKDKGYKLNELNVFYQPESWEILADMIEEGKYTTGISSQMYRDKITGEVLSYEKAQEYKASGRKVRELNVLPALDRVVWNAFYKMIYEQFEGQIHLSCKSYQRGMGCGKICKELAQKLSKLGHYEGVKTDLTKYFDTVKIEYINKELERMKGEAPSVIWDEIIRSYNDNRLIINGEVKEVYTSLRQGNPMSTILANLILRDVDAEMEKYDCIYMRYSDDAIFIGRQWREAYERFKEMIGEIGLILNDKKTERITDQEWFEFLGFSIKKDKISISSKTLRNIKIKVKSITTGWSKRQHRVCTEGELKKAIRQVQKYFFLDYAKNKSLFGMGVYLYSAVNVEHDIIAIDTWIKDSLRCMMTNKNNIYGLGYVKGRAYCIDDKNIGKNITANMKKTEGLLEKCGWLSLNKLKKNYCTSRELFEAEIKKL